ncbi:Conserved oligomeric Golgi complex subunit [Ceratocystis pirilliformis]|uniref:Conserved oligomeric Golgi complex subunit 5 n=1 Tax=Ceratocystis pirilliformis TaxID=259994 RepID=A0ABR3YHQ9_9PEZI
MNNNDYSYVDYRAFLDPTFQPPAFIRDLVQETSSLDDQPIDFSTPLSRILFDIQEINSNIDSVTTGSAEPLLNHTQGQNNASQSLTDGLDALSDALNRSHLHLEHQVGITYDFANMTRYVARRVTSTHGLLTPLTNFCKLSRQLEIHCLDFLPPGHSEPQNYPSLVRCAEVIISSKSTIDRAFLGVEARGLERLRVVNELQDAVISPISDVVLQQSNRIIREFSVPESETFAQSEASKLRLASSLHALYFMSYFDFIRRIHLFKPILLYQSVHAYIRNAVDSSTEAFVDFLGQLTLPHYGISRIIKHGRNIMALEHVMSTCWPGHHEVLPDVPTASSYLQTFQTYIGCQSLIRLFWHVLTDKLRQKVVDIIDLDSPQAQTLQNRTDLIVNAIREFIVNGSRMPESWVTVTEPQREDQLQMLPEMAHMVTAIVGVLRR